MFPALVGMNRTRLDYRQWVQVRTPAFKQRFGDWENDTENERPSTGVDRRIAEINARSGRNVRRAWRFDPDSREARRFYHGTADVFTQFDTTHPNRKDAGWLGRGVYVSSNRRIAEAYSNIKIGGSNLTVMTLFANVRHPYVATLEDKKIMARASQEQADEITQRMIVMGHDGAVLEFGDGSICLVVFSPNYIKFFIDNIL